jgi:hypothetical protein
MKTLDDVVAVALESHPLQFTDLYDAVPAVQLPRVIRKLRVQAARAARAATYLDRRQRGWSEAEARLVSDADALRIEHGV